MAAAKGPVTEFPVFANFEEKKRKSNLLMSFPKIVNQMDSFGEKRKKNVFCFCRPILDIFGFTPALNKQSGLVIKHDGHLKTRGKCRKHEPSRAELM